MRLFLALVISFAVTVGALPGAAETTIVAVVNGQPITNYDVSQRQKLMQLTGERGNLREKAIDELINEAVQIRAAKDANIIASDKQVDDAVAEIAQRVKLSPAQLKQVLSQQGITMETLRDRIRAQVAFGQLVRARFQAEASVTEQDLVAALLKDEELENTVDAALYTLERVAIALPEDPSSQRLARANATARDLRSKFTSCKDGLELAKRTRNVVVQPFGRRLESDLTQGIRSALKDVQVGRLSEPVQLPRALVMFAVCDKETVRSTNAAMKRLEDTMSNEKGSQFMKQYSRQLRRDAVVERF